MTKSDVAATGWSNSKLAGKNISKEIDHLKYLANTQNKDLIVFGSGQVVSSLMELGLIDEYQLWVHPVLLGKGKPLFKAGSIYQDEMLNMK